MKSNLLPKATPGALAPQHDTVNDAGGKAYAFTDEHTLAQLAVTGTLSDTFYVDAEKHLERTLEQADKVNPLFLAKVAVYAHEKGRMKDMPALLLAKLASRDIGLFRKVFPRIVTNGKMLRNFFNFIRSGITGRKSFGTAPKRMMQDWLLSASPTKLLNTMIGNAPTLKDIVKLARPKPLKPWQDAVFNFLLDKDEKKELLPDQFKELEAFRANMALPVPNVPLMFLLSLPLTLEHWKQIVPLMTWTQVRMNLNTLQRHGVLDNEELCQQVVAKLSNAELVRKSGVFPYQLLTAYKNIQSDIPIQVKNALQDAMEIALENVPTLPGNTIVACDVSGSMSNPVTTTGRTVASKTRNLDVAALITAAIVRKTKTAKAIGFDDRLFEFFKALNPYDSVMTIAQGLSEIRGSDTHVDLVLRYLLEYKVASDLVIIVSDNQSWCNGYRSIMSLWNEYVVRNPKAKLVCIDISPGRTSPAKEGKSVFNIGGFSDEIFTLLDDIANDRASPDFWVNEINKIEL